MKKFALMAVLAVLALAVPASATEAPAAPAVTLEQIMAPTTPVAPVEVIIKPIIQYCSAVNGTSCSPLGSTRACTDACHNQLSCTCVRSVSNPNQFVWRCSIEC